MITAMVKEKSGVGVEFRLLKECPEVIPTLVGWIYEHWLPYDPSLTEERLVEGFRERLHDDRLPLTIVAFREGDPVGVISLKTEEAPELNEIAEGSPWLGSLHVIESFRGVGIGSQLLHLSGAVAAKLGYRHIFLYTSDPDNVSWYKKQGAVVIGQQICRKRPVWVFRLDFAHE